MGHLTEQLDEVLDFEDVEHLLTEGERRRNQFLVRSAAGHEGAVEALAEFRTEMIRIHGFEARSARAVHAIKTED